ncbi:MAG: hypothetical protein OXH34_06715 [Bacteroidetes bacterium]|nr:hypothetical protein [Bacteroidota bacterium]
MALLDIYSKRKKRLTVKLPDVYQHDKLTEPFRVQVTYILSDLFQEVGPEIYLECHKEWYEVVHDALAREYGLLQLNSRIVSEKSFFNFILESELDQVFDIIEICFTLAKASIRHPRDRVVKVVKAAVFELNGRFNEHAIGYQYSGGRILRKESEFLHKETVVKAIHLLRGKHFAGAESEFMEAHGKYRQQQYEDAISGSYKALESTLKIICRRKGWSFDEKDTAKKLIAIVFDHGLIPKYLQSEFSSLRSLLESGIPTIRNKESAHGRGEKPRNVPAYLAAYVLHLTASTIVFLVEASRN